MVTLKQIKTATENLMPFSGDKDAILESIEIAMDAAKDALKKMDNLSVKGRDSVDTLLGCMMATEAIIGEEPNGQ